MNIYILQENYSYTDHEAGWDENGTYEEEVVRRDVIGVFTTLEEAVRDIAKSARKPLATSGTCVETGSRIMIFMQVTPIRLG